VRGALEAESEDHTSLRFDAFPAKQRISGVEPRGFEPLTSAVQSRTTISYLVLLRPSISLVYTALTP
jgi:hypothetical protein